MWVDLTMNGWFRLFSAYLKNNVFIEIILFYLFTFLLFVFYLIFASKVSVIGEQGTTVWTKAPPPRHCLLGPKKVLKWRHWSHCCLDLKTKPHCHNTEGYFILSVWVALWVMWLGVWICEIKQTVSHWWWCWIGGVRCFDNNTSTAPLC